MRWCFSSCREVFPHLPRAIGLVGDRSGCRDLWEGFAVGARHIRWVEHSKRELTA